MKLRQLAGVSTQGISEALPSPTATQLSALKKIVTPQNIADNYEAVVSLLASKVSKEELTLLSNKIRGIDVDLSDVKLNLEIMQAALPPQAKTKLLGGTRAPMLHIKLPASVQGEEGYKVHPEIFVLFQDGEWQVRISNSKEQYDFKKKHFPADKNAEAAAWLLLNVKRLLNK